MKKFLCMLSLVSMLAISSQAMAYFIALSPVNQNIPLNGIATVNIDLTVGGTEFLQGFNLALAFDNTILGFSSLTTTLLNPLDPFDPLFDYVGGFSDNGTEIALSGLNSANPLTNGTFTLASLNFTGNAYGTSQLNLTGTVLNLDPTTNVENLFDLTPASGSVDVVPEPGTCILLGLGLAGLVGYRSKCRKV